MVASSTRAVGARFVCIVDVLTQRSSPAVLRRLEAIDASSAPSPERALARAASARACDCARASSSCAASRQLCLEDLVRLVEKGFARSWRAPQRGRRRARERPGGRARSHHSVRQITDSVSSSESARPDARAAASFESGAFERPPLRQSSARYGMCVPTAPPASLHATTGVVLRKQQDPPRALRGPLSRVSIRDGNTRLLAHMRAVARQIPVRRNAKPRRRVSRRLEAGWKASRPRARRSVVGPAEGPARAQRFRRRAATGRKQPHRVARRAVRRQLHKR